MSELSVHVQVRHHGELTDEVRLQETAKYLELNEPCTTVGISPSVAEEHRSGLANWQKTSANSDQIAYLLRRR